MNDELAAHDAVGLGIAAALEAARLPQQTHLLFKALDDRVDPSFLVRNWPFLGELQPLVRPPPVDQGSDQLSYRIAQHRVERRTDERIEPAFQMDKSSQRVGQLVVEHRSGVGRRLGTADVRIGDGIAHVFSAEISVQLWRQGEALSIGTRMLPGRNARGFRRSCARRPQGSRRPPSRRPCTPH